jgi:SAM-dependent methyltransferase
MNSGGGAGRGFLVCLAGISGFVGLAYEALAQRALFNILGGSHAVYVAVTLTFILGMALGQLFASCIRNRLPQLEFICGAVVCACGVALRVFGYQIPLTLLSGATVLLVVAIFVGMAPPLYARCFTGARSAPFVYAVYNAGAAAGILILDIWLFFSAPLSLALTIAGAVHLILALALAKTLGMRFSEERGLPFSLVVREAYAAAQVHRRALAGITLFSTSVMIYHYLGSRLVVLFLSPMKIVYSVCLAASLLWVAVGAFIGDAVGRRGVSESFGRCLFGSAFLLHGSFALFIAPGLPSFLFLHVPPLPSPTATLYFLIPFAVLSPCLWSSAYFALSMRKPSSPEQPHSADTVMGVWMLVSSLAGIAGMVLGAFLSPRLLQPVMGLAIGAPLFLGVFLALKEPRQRLPWVAVGAGMLAAVVLAVPSPSQVLDANRMTRQVDTMAYLFRRAVADHTSDPREERSSLWSGESLRDLRHQTVQRFKEKRETLEQAWIYPTSSVFLGLHEDDSGMLGADGQPRRFYFSEGLFYHVLNFPGEYLAGLLPAVYFPGQIPESLVVGIGTAHTAFALSAVSGSTTAVDLDPNVVKNVSRFSIYNNSGATDACIRYLCADGIQILRSGATYDVILSTAAGAERSGQAKLYTEEFLSLAKSRLKPGGIFVHFNPNYVSYRNVDQLAEFLALTARHFQHVDIIPILQGPASRANLLRRFPIERIYGYVAIIGYDDPRPVLAVQEGLDLDSFLARRKTGPSDQAFIRNNPACLAALDDLFWLGGKSGEGHCILRTDMGGLANLLAGQTEVLKRKSTLDYPTLEIMGTRNLLQMD